MKKDLSWLWRVLIAFALSLSVTVGCWAASVESRVGRIEEQVKFVTKQIDNIDSRLLSIERQLTSVVIQLKLIEQKVDNIR